ncbi:MAG: 50S ribosomal protein L19 [Bacteroides sp.]|nr:MAG: 50S ribosomal protein L19 [Bacteroides sp.]
MILTNDLLQQSDNKEKLYNFKSGDTIAIYYKIHEGDKERIQIFQGTVIQIKGHSSNKTFTVRKISNNIGVEKIFPFNSPNISKIKLINQGIVRQSKIFYIRDKYGKKSKIKKK